jgi:hypothetical protein
MKETAILWPVIVQVVLTFAVLLGMGPARARSMREKGQSLSDDDVRLGRNAWTDQALKFSKNYANQFEMPVLFYAVVGYAMITNAVDVLMVGLAWIFALSRIVHTVIHVGPNVVMHRGLAFLVGFVALVLMWLKLAIHIL